MSKQKMWFRKASLLASPLMTLLLSSFLVAIAAPAETAELKVAVIDSMKIIEGTNAGKKMNESLKDYIAARQKILDTDADDLKAATAQKAAMAKATVPLLAAADAAAKANGGLRAVSIYPQLQNGHAVAEVTLLQGTVLKKVMEKLD